jgi:hypothetical protein
LPKYSGSIFYLQVILPGLLVCSSITVLMHTYYKTLNKEVVYFWQSVVILLLAVATDLIAYYCFIVPLAQETPVLLTVASDVTIFIWYILCEGYLCKHYHIKHWKNDFFMLCAIGLFVLISVYLTQWWGLLAYLISIVLLILLFYWKEIQLFRASRKKPTIC